MTPKVLVIGDVFLDRDVDGQANRIAPDAPVPVVEEVSSVERPGGAALAATLLARDDIPVRLLGATGKDRVGERLASILNQAGVEFIDLGLSGQTPEKIRVFAGDQSVMRLDRGAAASQPGAESVAGADGFAWADVALVSDYGRGIADQPWIRNFLSALAERAPVVWDPHHNGPPPVPGTWLATPNRLELDSFVPGEGSAIDLIERARVLAAQWRVRNLAVTRGEEGALLVGQPSEPVVLPAAPVRRSDACGAGDRFAGAAAVALAKGLDVAGATAEAVEAASSFVAAGGARRALEGGESSARTPATAGAETSARIRDRGGTLVATGGCFDLLHAGHVSLLEAARSMGDALVVLVNDDESVRALKGEGRPIVPLEDRLRVLEGLACVDAVVPFAGADPASALRRLRPDIWVKGADYAGRSVPESQTVASWGGSTVFVPLMEGRSTTRILGRARANGHGSVNRRGRARLARAERAES